MKFQLALATLLFSAPALAVLSPYWDRVTQIEAVMHAPALETALAGKAIDQIVKSPNPKSGLIVYKVISANCHTEVTLHPHSPDRPGAITYSVKSVGSLICK